MLLTEVFDTPNIWSGFVWRQRGSFFSPVFVISSRSSRPCLAVTRGYEISVTRSSALTPGHWSGLKQTRAHEQTAIW